MAAYNFTAQQQAIWVQASLCGPMVMLPVGIPLRGLGHRRSCVNLSACATTPSMHLTGS